ncbi:MAG: sigma-70 family RNA polymerase sigma factor [Eubacterium sp.]|nr:sigma-70 family RNA polymerase sigma factor [Eubacterium sp.]
MNTETNDMALSESFWREYEPTLRRICNYKLSSYPSEIDDVIGDTYLALCNAISKGIEIKNPKAWLCGTLNNIIKLKYTELDRKKKTYIRLESVEHELFYDVDFDSHELNDEVLNSIKDKIVDDLLDSEKTLLIFIYEKKLKFKEIAKILNTTENAIKQKHYRLKRKIKQLAKEKIKEYE